jgi:hypothetical protein
MRSCESFSAAHQQGNCFVNIAYVISLTKKYIHNIFVQQTLWRVNCAIFLGIINILWVCNDKRELLSLPSFQNAPHPKNLLSSVMNSQHLKHLRWFPMVNSPDRQSGCFVIAHKCSFAALISIGFFTISTLASIALQRASEYHFLIVYHVATMQHSPSKYNFVA